MVGEGGSVSHVFCAVDCQDTGAVTCESPGASHNITALLLPKCEEEEEEEEDCLLVGCLTSQQQATVSQGRICSDKFTCCHTEIEVADPTFYLTQSQYTDTGPTSPSADPITPSFESLA